MPPGQRQTHIEETNMKLSRLLAAALIGGLMLAPALGTAQETFPAKPIRVIVPFAPGGATDQVARLLATRVSGQLGVPVVVENRPGANGNIGAEAVAQATPDGYTLLHSTSALGFTAAFGQKVAYRLDQDLAPVSLLIDQPLLVMASKPLGVTNVQQLKDYAARHPGKLNYGSSGTGNLTHLAMFVLLQAAGIEATHIPYKGGAGAFPDFIAGRLDLFADPINSAYPYVRDGRVVALAVTGAQRSPLLPDVPTASEVILPGFQMGAWQALMAPAGTPPAVIARINDAYVQALNDPKVAAQLASQGAVPKATSPGDFQAFLQAEIERWRKVVQTSGIKLD
ncbi:tripartite tricarboxylate transporter family receptor [Bordetella bronchiseptica MBORD675]|nr:tripartite tricarboxylate transporter family receptor [Bordetella bronchiseptica CA90 BB02]KCV44566.1 tripartite tricarboxylate transporter family receptor [Bordetella bronchiseptica 345]KDC25036.1 tripartite tricarboxylate transporter family receptor [Bordetella bronchiseptica F4563]KDC42878.1 tripartite tricarboxylate transporter family receptor [Bordetella bronchiseptica GA96-01]KDC93080.1 tripartite tricarboxylate transporter family receptor [Bordetella bronchiseptica MBORD675]KDD99153.